MSSAGGPLKVAARLVALTATLGVLVATSRPLCGKHAPPVVFRAHGTCGPDGLVVASVDAFSDNIAFGNSAVLGLPPDAHGQSSAQACPLMVDGGGWQVRVPSCAGDAGTTAGCQRTCTVAPVSSGPLQFVCVDAKGVPLCTSTLTVEE